jgi:hypothetical protein
MSGSASLKVVTVIKEVLGGTVRSGADVGVAPAAAAGGAVGAIARLPASVGESLTVLERVTVADEPFYWVINRRGQFGVVPVESVRVAGTGDRNQHAWTHSLTHSHSLTHPLYFAAGLYVIAREAFAGGGAKISFAAGERIELVERVSAEVP